MQSIYMTYGGTNWGHCEHTPSFHLPIRPNRLLTKEAQLRHLSYTQVTTIGRRSSLRVKEAKC